MQHRWALGATPETARISLAPPHLQRASCQIGATQAILYHASGVWTTRYPIVCAMVVRIGAGMEMRSTMAQTAVVRQQNKVQA